ncbi:MAG: DUF3408 domain-containing protein [Rikenellaceae bacterium]
MILTNILLSIIVAYCTLISMGILRIYRKITKEINTEEPLVISKPPKPESRGKKSRMEEYLSLFLNFKEGLTNRFSKGKTIFISPEHHNKIQQIVSVVAGKEITITNYVDNILMHHLSHYEAEISEIYNSKNQFSQTHKK